MVFASIVVLILEYETVDKNGVGGGASQVCRRLEKMTNFEIRISKECSNADGTVACPHRQQPFPVTALRDPVRIFCAREHLHLSDVVVDRLIIPKLVRSLFGGEQIFNFLNQD